MKPSGFSFCSPKRDVSVVVECCCIRRAVVHVVVSSAGCDHHAALKLKSRIPIQVKFIFAGLGKSKIESVESVNGIKAPPRQKARNWPPPLTSPWRLLMIDAGPQHPRAMIHCFSASS